MASTLVPAGSSLAHRRASGAEWRTHWPLVLAATVGMSITSVHLYSLGVLLAPIAG